jgi:cytochrome P450
VSDLEHEETHVRNLLQVIPRGEDGWTEVFDIMPLFFRLTLESATGFLFGESVEVQLSAVPGYTPGRRSLLISEKDFASSFDQAQATIAKGARLGNKFWLVHDKQLKENCKRCHTFIDHYVGLALEKKNTSHAEKRATKARYVFLDALVESTQDPVQLRSQLLSILLAGRDTTASLLSYVFMSLTQYPHIYTTLRSTIIEDFSTYTNPKNLTFASLKSCNYLQWVLNETLRLYPVVPANMRRALRDTTLPRGGPTAPRPSTSARTPTSTTAITLRTGAKTYGDRMQTTSSPSAGTAGSRGGITCRSMAGHGFALGSSSR